MANSDTPDDTALPALHNHTIRTPRLLLRPLRLADADAVHAIRSDPAVSRFMRSEHDTHAATAAWVRSCLSSTHGISFVVELLPAHAEPGLPTAIGLVGGRRLPNIGYCVHRDAWGRGYAQEAVGAFVAFYWRAFPEGFGGREREWGRGLRAETYPGNVASENVLRKTGFGFVGEEEGEEEEGKRVHLVWWLPRPGVVEDGRGEEERS